MIDPYHIWLPSHGPQAQSVSLTRSRDPRSILRANGEPVVFLAEIDGQTVLATLYAAALDEQRPRRAYCAVPVDDQTVDNLLKGRMAMIDAYRQDLSWIIVETGTGPDRKSQSWAMVSPPERILTHPGYHVVAVPEPA